MSIDGTYDPTNIFARIIRDEAPCARVFEDDETLAFMDAFPQSDGHCLVVHKKSVARNLFEVDETDLHRIISTAQKIARALHQALKPDGVRIAQFNGAPAGQTVFHLHVHIIPVYADRPLTAHASGGPADLDGLKALAANITAAIA